jgi:nucleoside-diphosphate-sugar epimerase
VVEADHLRGHIVVTGAAGFIGSSLTDRLLADGYTVVGVDSFEDYYPREIKAANIAAARRHPAFTLLERNVLDAELSPVLDGAACVYHLAAQAGVRASWGTSFEVYTRNNVLGTQRLLEACVAAEVPKVVYASSSSVYGDQDRLPLREDMVPRPRSPYGVTKLAGEHLCQLYCANYGLETVSLRFFTVYGPRQRPDMAFHKFIRAMLEGRAILMYGDGSQTRDFTFIDDIVEGLVLASRASGGSVMNIGGGNRVSLAEAITTLASIVDVEPVLDVRPVEAGDVRDTWADTSRLREAVGYAPATTLEEGLARECEWLRTPSGSGSPAQTTS